MREANELMAILVTCVKNTKQMEQRPLCLNLLRELHHILLDSVRGRNKAPAEFRRIQNYIGAPGCSIEEATFVPPSVDQLAASLDNWEKYIHFEEKDRRESPRLCIV
jgi:Fic family protein